MPPAGHQSKFVALQLQVNLRTIIYLYRAALPLLRDAGAEHRNALVVNMSSVAGKSTAFCPGFVDTDMTDSVKGSVDPADMIRPEDIGKAVGFLLDLSPACIVPEIVFGRPGEIL